MEYPLYGMGQDDSINATAVKTIVEADNEIDPNPYNLSESIPGVMKGRSWTEAVNKRDHSIKLAANRPRSVNRPDIGIPVNLNKPQPVQPRNREGRGKRKVGVVGIADIPNITIVKTKIVNVFATKFTPDLEADVLRDFLKGKLNLEVQCHKIDTQRKWFALFKVTAESEDLNVLDEPCICPSGAFVRKYYEPRRPYQGTEAEIGRNTNYGVSEVRLPNPNGTNVDRGAIGGEDRLSNQPVLGAQP